MEKFSTHHMVSTTEMWNWRLNMSTEEFQMSYNSSNNEMEQRSYQKTNVCASYTLSSGELSSSSVENQTKKRKEERKKRKKEKRQIKEERRRKREERRRKGYTNKHAEDSINPPITASKQVKCNTDVFERVDRYAPSGSKSKDTLTWVASKVTKTTSVGNTWIANSNLNSQNNEINSNVLYEKVSSDEDSLLDFTPNPSEAHLIFPSDAPPESEVAVSVKQLSREELENVAIRHIAICKKYAEIELELDLCKVREENFHSMILQLNEEVIKLRTKIPPCKTTRSIGVQVALNPASGQQSSSPTQNPIQIKTERGEESRNLKFITSNGKSSNYLHTPPSSFGSSV